jgi:vacuolar-type H+-ATPase subunit F/Vma7
MSSILEKYKQKSLNLIDKKIVDSFSMLQLIEEDSKERQAVQKDLDLLLAAKLLPWLMSDLPMFKYPDPKVAEGEYLIGLIPDPNKNYSFSIQESEMLRHILIVGSSGSGKTNVTFLLIKHFLQFKKPFLVFDWKRNYRDLTVSFEACEQMLVFTVGREVCPFHFNPLIPPRGTSPTVWLSKLIEIMCHAYFLGEGVIYVLSRAIDNVYKDFGVYEGSNCWPTFRNVLYYLENYECKGRETQWLASALRAVSTLCFGEMNRILNSKDYPLAEIFGMNVILELDALTDSEKIFLTETLLLWLHHFRMANGKRELFRHACIIEEAHHMLSRRLQEVTGTETITDIIMREIREFGESIIVIDQDPSLLSIPALGNTYTTVCMNLKEIRDVNLMSSVLLLDSEEKERLTKLGVGEAIVKLQGRHTDPFFVKIPKVEVPKGSVTDEMLKQKMAKFYGEFGKIRLENEPKPEIRNNLAVNKRKNEEGEIKENEEATKLTDELTSNEKMMLVDVLQNPISKVKERYKRLGLNDYQGNKSQQGLIDKKLVQIEKLPNPEGKGYWGKTFQLTQKGKQALTGLGYMVEAEETKRKGGLQHRHLIRLIAKKLRKDGYEVQEEFPIGQGMATDILVNGSIALEVERSGKNLVENVKKNLQAGFALLIVCESYLSKQKIAEKLEQAGLQEKPAVVEVRELLEGSLAQFIAPSPFTPQNCTEEVTLRFRAQEG